MSATGETKTEEAPAVATEEVELTEQNTDAEPTPSKAKSEEKLNTAEDDSAKIAEDKRSKSRESLGQAEAPAQLEESKKSKSRESLDQSKRAKSRESLGAEKVDESKRSKSRESLGQAKIEESQRSKSRESLGEAKRSQSKENVAEVVVAAKVAGTTSEAPGDSVDKKADQEGEKKEGGTEEEEIPEPANRRCDKCDCDDTEEVTQGRKEKFVLQGKTFKNTSTLKYRIQKYSKDLDKKLQDEIFAKAFKTWSDVTNLKFKQVRSGKVSIVLSFEKGAHGDGEVNDFDGAWGVLAHAEFGGDIHFDEDEKWTHDSYKGVNLFQVSVHEIGHSLGLRHSSVKEAIMYADYTGYNSKFALHADDIAGIQRLYGEPSKDGDAEEPDQADTSCCLVKCFNSLFKK